MTISQSKFNSLLPSFQKKLESYISKNTSNRHDREDVFQETITAALHNLKELRDDSKVLAWLKSIALNTIRNRASKKKEKRWSDMYQKALEADDQGRKNLFDQFNQFIAKVAAAESSLDNLFTLALYFCFDYSPAEIAALWGNKINTIYGRIQRAKKKIKESPPKTITPEMDAKLKLELAQYLIFEAMFPVKGHSYRNSSLAQQAGYFARLTALQHPKVPRVLMTACMICFYTATLPQYKK